MFDSRICHYGGKKTRKKMDSKYTNLYDTFASSKFKVVRKSCAINGFPEKVNFRISIAKT